MQETQNLQTPDIFRLWGGISTVGAALQRNVWVETDSGKIFPNTYIFLVAPPGVGKGVMLGKLKSFLTPIEDIHFGRSDMSKASFIDELAVGEVSADPLHNIESYNSISVITTEMGTLLGEYDTTFMSVLTDLWNCVEYSEKKRHNAKSDIMLPRTHVNILVGTQPGFMQHFLPETAWEQGFLSRVLMVYASSAAPVPLWSGKKYVSREDELKETLQGIAKLRGPFDITKDARKFLQEWHMEGHAETDPTHPKLQNYNSRRTEHYLKLCMIAAASTSKKVLDIGSVERALDWLTNVEDNIIEGLQDITNTAISKDDIPTMVYEYVLSNYQAGKPIPEAKVVHYCHRLLRPHEVDKFLESMVKHSMLKKSTAGYRPGTIE